MIKKLALIATTAAVALTALVPGAAMARASHPGTYAVAKQVYVFEQPGRIFSGTAKKSWTFKVERLSPSGKYAYGMVYGHINRHAWIDASALKLKVR